MATKQENAEALTIPELQALAEEHDVNLTGLSAKADIAEAVAAGVTADVLADAVAAKNAPADEDDELQKQGPVADNPNALTGSGPGGYLSPEEAAERGVSAADLELSTPLLAGGEPRIIKSFPERPSAVEVEVATEEQPGFPEGRVLISDGEGGETEAILRPDDAARLAVATAPNDHPIHLAVGHGSNPNLNAWGDNEEARAANEEAYAARVNDAA